MSTIALIGQPNCGKSTLFNQIAGYRSLAANFPGATVTYTKGTTYLDNELLEVIDLPGTYSLSWYDDAEKETVKALFSMDIDVIVNIIDASMLIRSIELTLELMSLERPMVIALNMMDEAKKKGIDIDVKKLEDILGVKVVPIIAKKGKGIKELLKSIKSAKKPTKRCVYSKNVEEKIKELSQCVEVNVKKAKWPPKLLSIKAIEGFGPCEDMISNTDCKNLLIKTKSDLENGMVIINQRHALCMNIFENSSRVRKPAKRNIETAIDDVFMHPIFGYVAMFAIFIGIFYAVFNGGAPIENIVINGFDHIDSYLALHIQNKLLFAIAKGTVDGVGAAIGIALPYLLPFLFIISLLEDVGYLPRIAYLMDSAMHKMGVHGTSVIPFVAGYGCSVPAIMAIRILKSKKEKYISAFLASLVPCSARTTVIMGLVGYFLGYMYVIGLYAFNLLVILISGMILKRMLPGMSPEIIIDIPPYRMPTIKTLLLKTWHKVKDFVYLAIPMLIIGSIVLTLISYYHLDPYINNVFKPILQNFLGLPAALGVVLIFGILKKELTLIMLYQALGLSSISMVGSVMNHAQMLTFTVFVMFYIPCVATIAAINKEIGAKGSIFITLGTTVLALILAYFTKIAFLLI
jgi:ferrous iron transport protein B